MYFHTSFFSLFFMSQFKCYLLLLHCVSTKRKKKPSTNIKVKNFSEIIQHSFSLHYVFQSKRMSLLYVYSRTELKLKMVRGRQDHHSREGKTWRGCSFESGFNIIYLCDLPKTFYEDFDLKDPF